MPITVPREFTVGDSLKLEAGPRTAVCSVTVISSSIVV